eukprot:TRINITY_DN46905_c0_g1_i1.p1 TRINITY_DN46905_c0_g1~~TRINITY_DN46905_c0_g1_i1.p1  ORF type:complete len:487 (-),score=81.89 TRINITY_DN46905_c0_g1_i1:181-1641(-)
MNAEEPGPGSTTEKKGKFTRAQGASSGVESYAIGVGVAFALGYLLTGSVKGFGIMLLLSLAFQLTVMARIDRNIIWVYSTSQKFGPAKMRNASIGFAQCVKPGGKPTEKHSLELYDLPSIVTSLMFGGTGVLICTFNPFIALVRCFYPEHYYGCNKHRYLSLWWFFVRHPVAVQGEGPSNGDGLAAMNAAESLLYPLTPVEMERGPTDRDYWLEPAWGRPRFRDMFHDKLFVHRFFKSHGASCPKLVAEVAGGKVRERFLQPSDAKFKLIWKPRFSTMGLGVEWFTGWQNENGNDWAPSADPYIIEEAIVSTENKGLGEWYRCVTLWAYEEEAPKHSYIWRMRNSKGDNRVQTDIMGGARCVTEAYEPFIGSYDKGMEVDPRKFPPSKAPLDPKVHKALTSAVGLQLKMHKNLGKELWSIGWDVMIREDEPVFLEFNINNGFFVADHPLEECEQMCDFFEREFDARAPSQLYNFDPYAAVNNKKNQ